MGKAKLAKRGMLPNCLPLAILCLVKDKRDGNTHLKFHVHSKHFPIHGRVCNAQWSLNWVLVSVYKKNKNGTLVFSTNDLDLPFLRWMWPFEMDNKCISWLTFQSMLKTQKWIVNYTIPLIFKIFQKAEFNS